MKAWLAFAAGVDALNERVGRALAWLVLAVTLVSAGNAMLRYGFNLSSNAWLEIQWYLFGALVLLGAGYTLKHNGHVRIDVVYGRLGARGRAWVDLFGGLVFLLPLAGLMVWLGARFFWAGLGDVSGDAGGLPRWPVKLLIPLGFFLLWLQGVAECIRRVAQLRGVLPFPDVTQEEAPPHEL